MEKINLNLEAYLSKPKSGGFNSPLTQPRMLIAEMLGKSIGQIGMLTKGWTANELWMMYKGVQDAKNPPAMFWIKYKEFKLKNGEKIKERVKQRVLPKVRRKSWADQQKERQGLLF